MNVQAAPLRLAGTVAREPSFEVRLDPTGRFYEVRSDQKYFRYEVVPPAKSSRAPAAVSPSDQGQVLVRVLAQ